MRTWTMSACVVLAWSILSITLVAIGMTGSVSPAQANTRTARSTELTLTSTQTPAARFVTAVAPAVLVALLRHRLLPLSHNERLTL